jgi:hypothetical protein
MRKLISKSGLILLIVVLINLITGLLRLNAKDDIPYVTNRMETFVTTNQFYGRADTAVYIKTRTDLGHDSINLPKGILRVCDHYGFSNITGNLEPEILYLGDSFFDDPHISSTEGIQAQTNKKMKRNGSYNLGSNGCSGFRVYNELSSKYFTKKPKVIFFETVERALASNIHDAVQQLISKQYKSVVHHYYGLDLLLGANFKEIQSSNLFTQKSDKRYGYVRTIAGKKVWFLRNRLSEYAELNSIVGSMEKITKAFQSQNIKVVFIIAPDKESMYPELFGVSKITLLHHLMKSKKIEFIDVYSELLKNRDSNYYATDTHWNGRAIDLLTTMTTDYYFNSIAAIH